MKLASCVFLLATLLFLPACSTPESRIADNRQQFDQYPPDIQNKIKAGQVEVGFNEDMVRMALGEPDRIFEHKDPNGATRVWSYHHHPPRVAIGLGFASFGRHSAVGVGTEVVSHDPGEFVRVEFRNAHVVAVDYSH